MSQPTWQQEHAYEDQQEGLWHICLPPSADRLNQKRADLQSPPVRSDRETLQDVQRDPQTRYPCRQSGRANHRLPRTIGPRQRRIDQPGRNEFDRSFDDGRPVRSRPAIDAGLPSPQGRSLGDRSRKLVRWRRIPTAPGSD